MTMLLRIFPFLVFSIALSAAFALTPQLQEYFSLLITIGDRGLSTRLVLQLASSLTAYLAFSYFLARCLFFRFPEITSLDRKWKMALLTVFLGIIQLPGLSNVFALYNAAGVKTSNLLLIGAIVVLILTTILSSAVMSRAMRAQSSQSRRRSPPLGNERGAALVLDLAGGVVIIIIYIIYAHDVVGASHFFGLISTVYFAAAAVCSVVYVAMRLSSWRVPVGTFLTIVIIASYGTLIYKCLPYELTQLPANIPSEIYDKARSPQTLFDDHSIFFPPRAREAFSGHRVAQT
jgi:hypothetical protein